MKSVFIMLILTIFMGSVSAQAENLYVRPNGGSYGAHNGSDWTNAFNGFSDISWGSGTGKLGAGDTLWVAGGTYTQALSLQASGSAGSILSIKRALATDTECTTAAGWSAGFDSQVVLDVINSITNNAARSYITIDGRIADGIKLVLPDTTFNSGGVNFAYAFDHFQFKYMEIVGPAGAEPFYYVHGIRGMDLTPTGYSTDLLISHCNIHGVGTGIYLLQVANATIEYCDIYDIRSSNATYHENVLYMQGETVDNMIFRYNRVHNYDAEGVYCAGPAEGIRTGLEVYGNIFYDGGTDARVFQGDLQKYNTGYVDGLKFYNNTIVDMSYGFPSGAGGDANYVGGEAYNNIFYNVTSNTWPSSMTHDYNYYISSTFPAETHRQTGTSDPFADSSADNYHIEEHTTPGFTLSSPYNVDMDGIPRANPDRGAYEFPNTGIVNGVCGSASGQSFGNLTSSSPDLCYTGTVASFLETLPTGWTWGCNGYGGGTSTSGTACSATFSGDTTTPVLTWSMSSPQAITANSLAISGLCTDAGGVVGVKYRIGSAPDATYGTMLTGTTSWSGTATGFTSGANTLYVACYDGAGNYSTDHHITVNYTPPPDGTTASCKGCTSLKLGSEGGIK